MYKPVTPEDIKTYIIKKGLQLESRDYQLRIVSKAINHILIDKIDSVLIESPTGSGKTVMAQVIVQYLHDIGYSKSQSWVAMRRELLKQAERHSKKIGANYNMKYVSMFDKKPPITDLVVNDECQHDATNSATTQHTIVKPKLVIGMSATPFRSDSAKLFYKKVIRDANTRVLIKAGYLSKFNHYMINDWDPGTVASIYLEDPIKWGKSIVFFRTMEECEIFQAIIQAAGISIELVTQASNRDKQLESFEKGDTQVLVNMMILTEGFDCNTIDSAFIRDSSKGPTRQMAGRALRLNEGVIKNIVQSKLTNYVFTKVAEANNKYLEKDGTWELVEENKELGNMRNKAMEAIVMHVKENNEMSESLKLAYKKIGWGISKKRKKIDVMDMDSDEMEKV